MSQDKSEEVEEESKLEERPWRGGDDLGHDTTFSWSSTGQKDIYKQF